MTLSPDITMKALLDAYPGAQRALFRNFHIGGCASCGFSPEETLAAVCKRHEAPPVDVVLEKIREAHLQDEQVWISPAEASAARKTRDTRFLDIRTREEFDAVKIDGAVLFTQESLQEIMNTWPKDTPVIVVDHTGTRALDAAAYLTGHGFENVRALRGGIDAWSLEVDVNLPRYTVE